MAAHRGPQAVESPLELLTKKHSEEEPALNKIWGGLLTGSITFAAVCWANAITKRPAFSGIQKHIAFSAAAAYVGNVIDGWRRDYYAEKDAVLRHYVALHPEDFPPYERKKFADVLEPWVPVR